MQLTQPLHKGLQEKPQATVLICGERRRDFTTLVDRVARLAAVLQAQGVRPGDRVAMMGLNSDRYVEYLYATWWAGAVVNPVNIRWSDKEVAYSLDDSDTQVLLFGEHFSAVAAGLPGLSKSLRLRLFFGNGSPPEGVADLEALMARAQPVQMPAAPATTWPP
jgi:acyl-CoA synthetase (AMP-forming)/AMP-acid ligase II